MSRRPASIGYRGQVTAHQAVGGLAVVAALAIALVALCRWLVLDPTIDVRPDSAPPITVLAGQCPSEDDLPGEPVPVSSGALVACPDLFDGRLVSYAGEAVAAVLRRHDHAWIQLNDDHYGLAVGPLPEHRTPLGANTGVAVAVPLPLADSVRHVGDHWTYGDILEVTGRFLRADPADGGGPTIQADAGAVTRQGRPVEHPVATRKLVAAGLFGLVTLLAALELARYRRTT